MRVGSDHSRLVRVAMRVETATISSWALSLLSLTACAAQFPPLDSDDGRLVNYTLVAPELRESLPAMKRLLRQATVAGTVTAFRSANDRDQYRPVGGTDCVYRGWLAEVKRRGLFDPQSACPELSQAVKLGHSVAVRTLRADCTSRTVALRGQPDLFSMGLPGGGLRLLDLSVTPAVAGRRSGRRSLSRLEVFAMSALPASTLLASQLLTRLRQAVRENDITVILRNDIWFVEQCNFPLRYLFDGPPSIPTFERWTAGHQAVCTSLEGWPIQCY